MKFLIVAAKTGGHVFPALAISEELIKSNHEVTILGTGSDIENKAFKDLNSKTFKLLIQGFRGNNALIKLKVLFQVFINIFKVIKILRNEKIDAMIGFGGFITVPAGLACWIIKKPIFIHEQNSVLGSANKILSKISKINFLGMPIKNINNSIISGNPIRESFLNYDEENENNESINIYITGGSQGADYINKNIPKALKGFSNINIKHQSGRNNSNKVREIYLHNNIDAEVLDFYSNPQQQIFWSDFVISRAGALSLAEITSMNKGILMIPLPNSIDDHQLKNAESIQAEGMGIIHQQNDHIDSLVQKLEEIIINKYYDNWKKMIPKNHINAKKIILDNIQNYFTQK
ncbi:UDP-N-acetylglucosamine--N-acetylmuramyl-(pentapeptide) pyrophosphoryl-undecaprenol N-acetylglucosamine transferase [Gammaproteobacteria bacterium]|nr:UDP-N-acetylglucosamine--N-acetylmuramyl-(pentapeptide) pyrophosphoryl-undecaprenol N-acetylglucosamine transferase [Gammaproteobacteria bacterium]